ncbi:MAG: hypothetical protein WBG66_04290 [Geitlerinemataceae cyanobacterium]
MISLALTGTIAPDGHLRLDIPTGLAPGNVEVILVLQETRVSPQPKARKLGYDFSDLAGALIWRGDAVEMVRSLRDEW